MKKIDNRVIWGGLLIVAGVLFLLQELNILGSAFEMLWTLLMAAGGLVFLYVYSTASESWWAAIPGTALLGLAWVTGSDQLGLFPGTDLDGSLFLGSLALGFWLVYLRQQAQWWAIIPGGVLLTLSLVSGFDYPGDLDGGIFFLGLAVTFGLVALLPTNQADNRWAFIPAAALGILGLALSVSLSREMINIIFPSAIILAGGYLLVRSIVNK